MNGLKKKTILKMSTKRIVNMKMFRFIRTNNDNYH